MTSFFTNIKKIFRHAHRIPEAIKLTIENAFRTHRLFRKKQMHGFSSYTCLVSVYNKEKYLDEFFQSVTTQLLDFKNNIKIIIVDDGSTDNSAKIIKTWQERFPENISSIYQENAGLSSARNTALQQVKEGWILFIDPDDFIDLNFFLNTDNLLAKECKTQSHEAIGLISAKFILYYENFHPVFRYSDTCHLKNNYISNFCKPLSELDQKLELSASKCFYDAKIVHENSIRFLDVIGEDAYFNIDYRACTYDRKALFTGDSIYYYRKSSGNNSITDTIAHSGKLYVEKLQSHLSLFDKVIQKYNHLKEYILNIYVLILHSYTKKIYNKDFPAILDTASSIKLMDLLAKQYALLPEKNIEEMQEHIIGYEPKHVAAILSYFKKAELNQQTIYIEAYDANLDQCLLVYYCGENSSEEIFLGEKQAKIIASKLTTQYLGNIACSYQKKIWIDLENENTALKISINGKIAHIDLCNKKADSFPAEEIRKAFPVKAPSALSSKYINAWLFMDREEVGDDNAEHLYRYVQKNHPAQKIFFVLKKNTPSWNRLEQEGFALLSYKSLEFQRAIRGCSAIISSHFDLYLYILDKAPKHLTRIKHFWLRHGVSEKDQSQWLNESILKLDLLLSSSTAEYNSIASEKSAYAHTTKEVKLLGLPRHDALVPFCKKHEDAILIMPTWRRELQYIQDKEELQKHTYIQHWSSLLQSSKLQELASYYQKKIIFFLHPSAQKFGNLFKIPSHIEIAEQQTHKIQDLFKTASFMITDYSSVAFDMAFLQKAVIYYQFDYESFFEKQWKKGYFSYEEHGLGPVATKEEELLTAIENMLSSSELPEKYIKNIDSVFPFRDGKNCERVCKTLFDKMNTTS